MQRKLVRLRELREARFLSQQELAQRAGMSRVAITRLESGDVEAQYATVRKLALSLGVEPQELIAESADAKMAA
jgi:transcriptional regulator with XRE-family HTH domain